MEELPEELQKRKLYVEDAMLRKRNKNDRYRCLLSQIAVEFVRRLPISPLATGIDCPRRFLPCPGVYLIYYVGETSLYGNSVKPSESRPIYVGMSSCNVLDRLRHHSGKVGDAKDLELRNFAVRFLIVDIEHYAPSIERALIEYYNPLWNNDKNIDFSFGNADAENNNWRKYHVDQNENTITDMIGIVRKFHKKS